MRTLDDVIEQYAFHPGTPAVAPLYDVTRAAAIRCASDVWDVVPDGPEKTLAMRSLQQFLMYSNLAIALTVPAQATNPPYEDGQGLLD